MEKWKITKIVLYIIIHIRTAELRVGKLYSMCYGNDSWSVSI